MSTHDQEGVRSDKVGKDSQVAKSEGQFAVIVCYLDDSGEDRDPVATLAGYVGTVGGWAAFELQARAFFDSEGIEYLHTVDLHQRRGHFKGWCRSRTLAFVTTLFGMVGECAPVGVEFSVDKAVFKRRKAELGKKGEGSPLTFCFKGLLHNMMANDGMTQALGWDGVDLSFIVESGKRSEPMVQTFASMKATGTYNGALRSMELIDKKALIALQAADFLAFFSRRLRCMDKANPRFDEDWEFFVSATRSVSVHSQYLATNFS